MSATIEHKLSRIDNFQEKICKNIFMNQFTNPCCKVIRCLSECPYVCSIDLQNPPKRVNDLAKGLIILSLLLINFKIILFADLGPKPGSFENCLISSSISIILL